jgi:type VI secretion system protein ImpA
MATAEVFDIESLVALIEGDAATGADLRESGSTTYQELKDARRTIASLSRAKKFDSQSDNEIDDYWRLIFKKAPDILSTESKDLEVAAWLVEAALKLHGFPGLRDGFKLVRRLTETFWDSLYPMPDEDGLETRVYPITGLNGEDGRGTLIIPIRTVLLSEDADVAFTFNTYDRCIEASKIKDIDAQQQRFADIGTNLLQIQAQVNAGSEAFYRTLIEDVETCLEEFNSMSQLLDEKCGYQYAPPSSAIKEGLSKVLDALRHVTKDKFASNTAEEASPADGDSDGQISAVVNNSGAGSAVAVGAIASRHDAINHLLLVADYFRKTEPHSPLCGALERVARWGRLSFQELMSELIVDASARANFSQLTGIPLGDDAEPIGSLASTAKPVSALKEPVPAAPKAVDPNDGW